MPNLPSGRPAPDAGHSDAGPERSVRRAIQAVRWISKESHDLNTRELLLGVERWLLTDALRRDGGDGDAYDQAAE